MGGVAARLGVGAATAGGSSQGLERDTGNKRQEPAEARQSAQDAEEQTGKQVRGE